MNSAQNNLQDKHGQNHIKKKKNKVKDRHGLKRKNNPNKRIPINK